MPSGCLLVAFGVFFWNVSVALCGFLSALSSLLFPLLVSLFVLFCLFHLGYLCAPFGFLLGVIFVAILLQNGIDFEVFSSLGPASVLESF